METFENDFDEIENEKPTFLKALVILTWVFVGLKVMGNLSALTNTTLAIEQLQQSTEILTSVSEEEESLNYLFKDAQAYIEASIENIKAYNYAELIIYLLEGFAALLMFNLKKIGYWLYLACQIGIVLSVFWFFPSGNVITTATITMVSFGAVLFSILYGVNYKYLK